MRTVYVAVCVVLGGLVGAKLATAERQVETKLAQETIASRPKVASGGLIECPLWPIADLGGGIYMFYAERFDNWECLNPDPYIFTGDAPNWPYLCPDCFADSLVSPETERGVDRKQFAGLDEKLPASFLPAFPEGLGTGEGVSVSERGFAEYSPSGTESSRRLKLFQVTLDRRFFGSRRSAPRTFGLGYEVVTTPETVPTSAGPDMKIDAVRGSDHLVRLRQGTTEYIVLLAK